MTDFWTCWLKTPMAAPESAGLKELRVTILTLCVVLFVSVFLFARLEAAIGDAAGGVVAGILVALIALVPFYCVRKVRADNAFLDAGAAEENK